MAENARSPTQTVGKHPTFAVFPDTFVSGIQERNQLTAQRSFVFSVDNTFFVLMYHWSR